MKVEKVLKLHFPDFLAAGIVVTVSKTFIRLYREAGYRHPLRRCGS
jgi:hypothetical protein